MLSEALNQIPPILRNRVWKINGDNTTLRLKAILSPILRETQVEFDGYSATSHKKGDTQAFDAVALLALIDLRPFILALENELQVDIDLAAIKERLAVLDAHLSSSEARAHLAMLKLIFGAYEKRQVNELELLPASPSQRVEAFLHFMEDATYNELSKERRLFGFPAQFAKAAIKFDRLTETLANSSLFHGLLSIGTRSIETVTKLPMPNAKMLESLITTGYLPPIISLKESRARAREAWKRVKPAFKPPMHFADEADVEYIDDDSHPDLDSF